LLEVVQTKETLSLYSLAVDLQDSKEAMKMKRKIEFLISGKKKEQMVSIRTIRGT
jgi:hypothetical protein